MKIIKGGSHLEDESIEMIDNTMDDLSPGIYLFIVLEVVNSRKVIHQ